MKSESDRVTGAKSQKDFHVFLLRPPLTTEACGTCSSGASRREEQTPPITGSVCPGTLLSHSWPSMNSEPAGWLQPTPSQKPFFLSSNMANLHESATVRGALPGGSFPGLWAGCSWALWSACQLFVSFILLINAYIISKLPILRLV